MAQVYSAMKTQINSLTSLCCFNERKWNAMPNDFDTQSSISSPTLQQIQGGTKKTTPYRNISI